MTYIMSSFVRLDDFTMEDSTLLIMLLIIIIDYEILDSRRETFRKYFRDLIYN